MESNQDNGYTLALLVWQYPKELKTRKRIAMPIKSLGHLMSKANEMLSVMGQYIRPQQIRGMSLQLCKPTPTPAANQTANTNTLMSPSLKRKADMEEHAKEMEAKFIGRKFKKVFEGKTYSGIIRSYVMESSLFRVVYCDGDSEELDLKEVQDLEFEGVNNNTATANTNTDTNATPGQSGSSASTLLTPMLSQMFTSPRPTTLSSKSRSQEASRTTEVTTIIFNIH